MSTAIHTNLALRAVTQFMGFQFNSLAVAHGKVLGVNSSGLFTVLDGSESDNGTEIDAWFATPDLDLGATNPKRLRFIHVGGVIESDLDVEIIPDGDEAAAATITVDAASGGLRGKRVACPRSVVGHHLRLKFANKNGEKFAINRIATTPIVLSEREV